MARNSCQRPLMVFREKHLAITTKGSRRDVVQPRQQNEIPEGLRIVHHRLIHIAGYSDVNVKMADLMLDTKTNQFLSCLIR